MQDIIISRRVLTDGSSVFDVVFADHSFPAITENDATALAEKFRDAVGQHTNTRLITRYDY